MSHLLCLALLALLLGVPPLNAQVIQQRLDVGRSRATFVVNSERGQLEGSFTELAGELNLDTRRLVNSTVTLRAVPAAFNLLWGENNLDLSPFTDRFPRAIAVFRSHRIVALDRTRYRVIGTVDFRGQSKELEVPVTVESSSPQQSVFTIRLTGNLNEAADQLPLLALSSDAKTTIQARLVFRTQR